VSCAGGKKAGKGNFFSLRLPRWQQQKTGFTGREVNPPRAASRLRLGPNPGYVQDLWFAVTRLREVRFSFPVRTQIRAEECPRSTLFTHNSLFSNVSSSQYGTSKNFPVPERLVTSLRYLAKTCQPRCTFSELFEGTFLRKGYTFVGQSCCLQSNNGAIMDWKSREAS
jgi:hypothetical protein